MNWDTIIPAIFALVGALLAIFGSHSRINKNVLNFLDEILGYKAEIQKLLDELTELRDELKRND